MGRGRQEAGRQRFLPYTLLFYILLSISRTSAQDTNTLTCDTPLTVEGIRYDLQQLDVQHSASYTSDSPPTQEELIITFNACRDIEIPSSVPESDKVRLHYFSLSSYPVLSTYSVQQGLEHVSRRLTKRRAKMIGLCRSYLSLRVLH